MYTCNSCILSQEKYVCRPVKVQCKIQAFKICLLIVCISLSCFVLFNFYNNLKSFGLVDLVICILTIAVTSLYDKSKAWYTEIQDKKLRDHHCNTEGYTYQGRPLLYKDIHFIQHMEYHKKHQTWIIPANTNLDLYTPENPEKYSKPFEPEITGTY